MLALGKATVNALAEDDWFTSHVKVEEPGVKPLLAIQLDASFPQCFPTMCYLIEREGRGKECELWLE